MWCPKCKNEYVPGITHCADCGTELIESLNIEEISQDWNITDSEYFPKNTSSNNSSFQQFSSEETSDNIPEDFEDDTVSDSEQIESDIPAHAYVSKKTKKEDVKSTAYTFTAVSIIGIILLILFWTGVLPLNTAFYMKVMLSVVMGSMFVIFFIVGIRSFKELKILEQQADNEENSFAEITKWFRQTYTSNDIDAELDTEQQEEMLYFARYEKMRKLILENYEDLESSFLDHIIETLYAELF